MALLNPVPRACAACGQGDVPLKACGRCKEPLYCGADCQRKDWKAHKRVCMKEPGGDAEKLAGTHVERGRVAPPAPATGLGELFRLVEDLGTGADGASKGGGAVASRAIACGTVITREQPLLSMRGEEVGMPDVTASSGWTSNQMGERYNKQFPLIRQKFERLSEEAQGMYLTLADTVTHSKRQRALVERLRAGGHIKKPVEEVFTATSVLAPALSNGLHGDGMKSVEGVFCTNCIPGVQNETAVYMTICRFNHSCVANAAYNWREGESAQVVLATRDIAEGEEICVSYFDSRFLSVQKRKDRTSFSWGFECECEACALPGYLRRSELGAEAASEQVLGALPEETRAQIEAAAGSERRRRRLGELDEALNGVSDLDSHGKIWKEMQSLYTQEGLLPNLFVERAFVSDLLQAQAAFGGKEKDLARLCHQLHEIHKLLEGPDHPETRTYKRWSECPPRPQLILQHIDQMSRS